MQVREEDNTRMIVIATAPVNIFVEVPERVSIAKAVEDLCTEVSLANPGRQTTVLHYSSTLPREQNTRSFLPNAHSIFWPFNKLSFLPNAHSIFWPFH